MCIVRSAYMPIALASGIAFFIEHLESNLMHVMCGVMSKV